MTEEIKVFGVSLELLLIILLALILILGVTLIVTIRQLQHVSRKYYILMSGKKGKDLEGIMLERFREMDELKVQGLKALSEHVTFRSEMDAAVTKVGIIKYDALENMSGNLSFAAALLNEENTGVVFNVVHSRENCYTYAKEVTRGTSLTALCQEERDAIQKAIDSGKERAIMLQNARAAAEKEARDMELEAFFRKDEEKTRRRMKKAAADARREMRRAAGEPDTEETGEKPRRKKSGGSAAGKPKSPERGASETEKRAAAGSRKTQKRRPETAQRSRRNQEEN